MILVLNESGKILSVCSEQMAEEKKISLLKGHSLYSFVAKSDTQLLRQFLKDVDKSNSGEIIQIHMAITSGESIDYWCMAIPNQNETTTLLVRKSKFPNIVTDQFRQMRDRIRPLFNNVPIAMIVLASDGHIEAVNDQSAKLLDYSVREFTSKHAYDLLKDKKEIDKESFIEFIKKKIGRIYQLKAVTKKEKLIPVDMFAQYMDSKESRILLTLFDISERVEIDKIKKEFVNMISHDIRTPMANVSLFLESIAEGICRDSPEEELELRAREVGNEVERLLKLVNNLLSVDRIDHQPIKVELKQVSISSIIAGSQNSIKDLARSKNISLITSEEELVIKADQDQIVRVMINLLGNALNYSPENSTVTVHCEEHDYDIEIQVIDSGPGIPEEKRNLIFQKYAQLGKTTEATSGLGLAICKQIVEAHDGEIGVKEGEAGGSIFWFRIPKF